MSELPTEAPVSVQKPVLQIEAPKSALTHTIERVRDLNYKSGHDALIALSQVEVEEAQKKINKVPSAPEIKLDPKQEVKPREIGLLAKSLESLTEKERDEMPKVEYLMVFGQGPVQDQLNKTKETTTGLVEANSWMRTNARAAAELKLAGLANKIVLTGGTTGAEGTPSEAALMKEILVNEYGISDDDIILEDKATNTLQNFSFSLNTLYDRMNGTIDTSQIGFLGSHFHLARIRDLGHLYGIDGQNAFSAEMIMDYIADLDMDADPTYNRELQNVIKRRLEIDEDQSHYSRLPEELRKQIPFQSRLKEQDTYFGKQLTEEQRREKQPNEEAKGSMLRTMNEKMYTRGLLEEPGYWVGYAAFLNDALLTDFVKNQAPETLAYIGINDKMSLSEVRDKLMPYTDKKRTRLDSAFGEGMYDDYQYTTARELGRVAKDLNPPEDNPTV